MRSLTSDVNGLEGEPLHSSALPKDIASLNIARQQELAEPLVLFWRLELQIKKQMIKTTIGAPIGLLDTVITSLRPRFKSSSEGPLRPVWEVAASGTANIYIYILVKTTIRAVNTSLDTVIIFLGPTKIRTFMLTSGAGGTELCRLH